MIPAILLLTEGSNRFLNFGRGVNLFWIEVTAKFFAFRIGGVKRTPPILAILMETIALLIFGFAFFDFQVNGGFAFRILKIGGMFRFWGGKIGEMKPPNSHTSNENNHFFIFRQGGKLVFENRRDVPLLGWKIGGAMTSILHTSIENNHFFIFGRGGKFVFEIVKIGRMFRFWGGKSTEQ